MLSLYCSLSRFCNVELSVVVVVLWLVACWWWTTTGGGGDVVRVVWLG